MPMFDGPMSRVRHSSAPTPQLSKELIIARLGTQAKELRPALLEIAQEWIVERESVRLQRLAGSPPPWTAHHELNLFRFTNVRRFDDKVTQWLLKHWYEPYRDHENLPLAAAIGRLINYIPSLEQLPWPTVWDPAAFRSALDSVRGKVFTSAYIVTGAFGGKKTDQVVDVILDQLARSGLPALRSVMREPWRLQHATHYLSRFPGFSTFMAGQVLVDLAYLYPALDLQDWAPRGPGSLRWIRAWSEEQVDLTDEQFVSELRGFRTACIQDPRVAEIDERLSLWLHDWQNICCELGKIYNFRVYGVPPRNRYRPGQ